MWFIANVLLCFVPSRGLLMLTLTGLLMVMAAIVYHVLQPSTPLRVPFQDDIVKLSYGWSFWLCFAVGWCMLFTKTPAITTPLCAPQHKQHHFRPIPITTTPFLFSYDKHHLFETIPLCLPQSTPHDDRLLTIDADEQQSIL